MSSLFERGHEYERSIPSERRRREGIHYTSADLSATVVARAFDALGRPPTRVLDPTCGGGAFLLAALDALVEHGVEPGDALGRVRGIDADGGAVRVARRALHDWATAHGVDASALGRGSVRVGDALVDAWPREVDLVVGNPPFGGQLRGSTVRDPQRASIASAILGAAAGYADTAGLFLVRAVECVRSSGDHGVVAMVQPASVLASRDAAAVRRAVDGVATVREVLVPDVTGFDASVHVCVPVVVVGGGVPAGARDWSDLAADALGLDEVGFDVGGPTLGDLADPTAGFRDEFYAVARFVREEGDMDEGGGDERSRRARPRPRLVTVGSIEPGRVLWGERSSTVLRRRFLRPVVDLDAFTEWAAGPHGDARLASLAAVRTAPKVLVATQTRVIEAMADPEGDWWPAVPVVSVLPRTIDVWHVLAALVSREASTWMARRTVGTGLSAGATRISARALAALPVPRAADADDTVDGWDRAAELLRCGATVDDPRVLDAMSRAYGSAG